MLEGVLQELQESQKEILRRQQLGERVLHQVVGILRVHGEKLDAILEAATDEGKPSETAKLLQEIVRALKEQTETLNMLPQVLGEVIRDELLGGDDLDGVAMEEEAPRDTPRTQ